MGFEKQGNIGKTWKGTSEQFTLFLGNGGTKRFSNIKCEPHLCLVHI